MRAILFHHVGGDHYAFQAVQEWLSPDFESFTYELPGRADRIREPLLHTANAVLDDAFRQTEPWRRAPFCLIGVSLGGLLAYALTQRLQEHGLPLPVFIGIASRKCPVTDTILPQASQLPEDAFWAYVLQYGGCPPELPKHRELREFFGPILRADFAVAEDLMRGFRYNAPLKVPAGIYYGQADHPDFAADNAGDWAAHFHPAPEFEQFPGGHFFLYEDPAAIQHIKSRIRHGG